MNASVVATGSPSIVAVGNRRPLAVVAVLVYAKEARMASLGCGRVRSMSYILYHAPKRH